MVRSRITPWLLVGAVVLFAGCGPSRVERLIGDLSDESVSVRRRAAKQLATFDAANSPECVPALESALSDPDREVRRLACHALGGFGALSSGSLPRLKEALQDRQLSVSLAAAFAIPKISPEETAHVPILLKIIRQGEGGVIVEVAKMGESAKWAAPTLIGLLKDNRPGIRRLAANALQEVGGGGAKSVLEAAARNDPDDRVRHAAREALKGIADRE